MKKVLLGSLVLMLAACSNSSNNGPAPTEQSSGMMTVDVAKLQDGNQTYEVVGSLDLGVKSEASAEANKTASFRVINSATSQVNFNLEQIETESFAMVDNSCTGSLEAGTSCDITVEFNGGLHKNGQVEGAMVFTASGSNTPNQSALSVKMLGEIAITGNDVESDGDDDGQTELSLDMNTVFSLGVFPIQVVTVTNVESDPARNLNITVTGDYQIFANNCPSNLEEGEECKVYLLYKNFLTLSASNPSEGTLRVASEASSTFILSLTQGTTTEE